MKWRMYGAAVCWLVLIVAGSFWLHISESTPANTRISIRKWPHQSSLSGSREKMRMVAFLHPLCPCSKATLKSLEDIARFEMNNMEVICIFWMPESTGREWEESSLIAEARKNHHVRVVLDRGGKEMSRFGATASGETFLFDQNDELLMHGGITPRRAIADFEYCKQVIEKSRERKGVVCNETYGCSLLTPTGGG